MHRSLFTSLSALSLACGAVTAALWMRAQMGDAVWVRFVGNSVVLYGAEGQAATNAPSYFFDPRPGESAVYVGPSGLLRMLRSGRLKASRTDLLGVEAYVGSGTAVLSFRAVVVPVAYPVAAFAVAPAAWVVARIRRGRRARGGHCCAACGYDLRATPDSRGPLLDRCPECGRPTPTAAGAAPVPAGGPTIGAAGEQR